MEKAKAAVISVRFVAVVASLACIATGCGESSKGTGVAQAAKSEKIDALARARELDGVGTARELLAAPEDVVWTMKAPEGDPNPPKRMFHGLAYDQKAGLTVLFGGTTTGDVDGVLNDTWTWNGTKWTKLTPAKSPPARFGFDMVYSTALQAVVLYGGVIKDSAGDYAPQGDTWTWNGTTWSEITRKATDPPLLAGHSMAYDSKRGVVVLYGGYNQQADNKEVWELGAQGWVNKMHASSGPGSLDSCVMTYDDALGATVIFGGTSPAGSPFIDDVVGDTYTWDGTVWKHLNIAGPDPRSGSLGAFDTKRKRTVIFGGTSAEGIDFDETWEFSAGAWELREPLRKPQALSNGRFTYDTARDRIVAFGGYTFSAEGETWEYSHFGAVCKTTADCDGYSCVDGVCCKVATCGTCQACSATTGVCEAVKNADDANGNCSGTQTCNAQGVCVAKTSTGCKVDGECATHHCVDGVCCNDACTGSCQSCTETGKVGTCTAVTGNAARGTCPGTGACASSCNGTDPDCVYVGPEVDCGSSCADATFTLRLCDGSGECKSAAPVACQEHSACKDATSCGVTCTKTSDCSSGFVCQNGSCSEPSALCLDDTTASGVGGTEDCKQYKCQNGKCRTNCRDTGDCAPGRLCSSAGECIADPGAPGNGGASGNGGTPGDGGETSTGGASDTGGRTSTGGATGGGAKPGNGGSTGTTDGGVTPGKGDGEEHDDSGCSVERRGTSSPGAPGGVVLAAFAALALLRRTRAARAAR